MMAAPNNGARWGFRKLQVRIMTLLLSLIVQSCIATGPQPATATPPAPPAAAAPTPAPGFGASRPRPAVLDSYWAVFDRQRRERNGYGLYTYVLMPIVPPAGSTRLKSLVDAVTALVSSDSFIGAGDRRSFNIFYFPVTDARRLRPVAAVEDQARVTQENVDTLIRTYDYIYAKETLGRLCTNSPDVDCSGTGPYFAIAAKPASQPGSTPPLLLIDLSLDDEAVFEQWVAVIKAQVTHADWSKMQKLTSARMSIANDVVTAEHLLPSVIEAADKIHLFK